MSAVDAASRFCCGTSASTATATASHKRAREHAIATHLGTQKCINKAPTEPGYTRKRTKEWSSERTKRKKKGREDKETFGD